MPRKLAISDNVLFPVTLVVNNGKGGTTPHKFSLIAARRDSESMRKTISDDSLSVDGFLCEVVCGWEGQRLVLDVPEGGGEAEGSPSAFSTDAFRDMLTVAGAPAVILGAYLKAVTAKEKN